MVIAGRPAARRTWSSTHTALTYRLRAGRGCCPGRRRRACWCPGTGAGHRGRRCSETLWTRSKGVRPNASPRPGPGSPQRAGPGSPARTHLPLPSGAGAGAAPARPGPALTAARSQCRRRRHHQQQQALQKLPRRHCICPAQ